jgi:dihydrofolate reductase
MNAIPKIVFSKTLEKAEWNNTRLIKGYVDEEILKLKQQPGQDWYIFGSADLAAYLTQRELIDEYRIIVNPVAIGSGMPLFKDLKSRLDLKLIKARTFRSGNVLLYYEPVNS